MWFVDIIIIITLLLLASAIGVSIWSSIRLRRQGNEHGHSRLFISIAAYILLLFLVGWFLLPVDSQSPTIGQRAANMFIVAIGLLIVLAVILILSRLKTPRPHDTN